MNEWSLPEPIHVCDCGHFHRHSTGSVENSWLRMPSGSAFLAFCWTATSAETAGSGFDAARRPVWPMNAESINATHQTGQGGQWILRPDDAAPSHRRGAGLAEAYRASEPGNDRSCAALVLCVLDASAVNHLGSGGRLLAFMSAARGSGAAATPQAEQAAGKGQHS